MVSFVVKYARKKCGKVVIQLVGDALLPGTGVAMHSVMAVYEVYDNELIRAGLHTAMAILLANPKVSFQKYKPEDNVPYEQRAGLSRPWENQDDVICIYPVDSSNIMKRINRDFGTEKETTMKTFQIKTKEGAILKAVLEDTIMRKQTTKDNLNSAAENYQPELCVVQDAIKETGDIIQLQLNFKPRQTTGEETWKNDFDAFFEDIRIRQNAKEDTKSQTEELQQDYETLKNDFQETNGIIIHVSFEGTRKLSSAIQQQIKSSAETACSGFDQIKQDVKKKASGISSATKEWSTSAAEKAIRGFDDVKQDLKGKASDISSATKEFLSSVPEKANRGFDDVKQDLKGKASDISSATKEFLSSVPEKANRGFDDVKQDLKGKASDISSATKEFSSSVAEKANRGLDDVKQNLKKKVSDISSTTKEFSTSVAEKANRSLDDVKQNLKEKASDISSATKNFSTSVAQKPNRGFYNEKQDLKENASDISSANKEWSSSAAEKSNRGVDTVEEKLKEQTSDIDKAKVARTVAYVTLKAVDFYIQD